MAEKRKKEKFGRRIKNWVLDRDYVFFSFLFVVVLITVVAVGMGSPRPQTIVAEDLSFSKDSGFYGGDLEVEIVAKKSGEIRFNLNGDDINNTSEKYGDTIKLEVPEEGYKVYTLGAALCEEAEECRKTEHKTYVLGKKLDEDVDLDIISITSSQKNLYDYEYGIMVGGKTFDDNSGKGLDYVPGNYNQRSDEWIRNSHVTGFSADGSILFDKDLGIQISGGTSAAFGVKSLKILGNKKYGFDKIPFDFGDGLEVYNTIRLRSGAQDQYFGNIRSSIVSRLSKESNFDGAPDTKRVVCFLNGDFYGIFDAQQNYSSSYLAKKFGLPNSDFVITEKDNEPHVLREMGARELLLSDLNNEKNIELLEDIVDMDDFLTYYALQILWNNTDWPNNNYEGWKYVGDRNDINKYTDGRLRFLVYDTDMVYYTEGNALMFDGAVGDQFATLMNGVLRAEDSVFKNVVKSDYYRNRFVGILRNLINGPFETENVLKIVDEEAAKIDKQMQLFYTDEEYEEWQGWIELLKKAVSERNNVVRADARKYFSVEL